MQRPIPSPAGRWSGRHRGTRAAPVVAWIAAAAGDAWWVASTRPFTDASDAAVLGGAVVVGVVAVRTLRRRRRLEGLPSGSEPSRPRIVAWMVVTAFIVVYELVTFLAGAVASRQAFPTVSSLYDAAARSRDAKGAIVFVWLALGWSLFRR